eukprot:scaffold90657_cov31-Tisochrysis_lutea.AAC.4
MAMCIYSLAIRFHSSLVMFNRFSHAGLAACGAFLRVAFSAALEMSETDIALETDIASSASAIFPFRMAYSSAPLPLPQPQR